MRPSKDLLDRVDAAEIGGPELDREIADACLEKQTIERVASPARIIYPEVWVTRDGVPHWTPPPFTTKLDPVLLLYAAADVPEKVPSDPLVACRQALRYRENRARRDPVPGGSEAARRGSSSLASLMRDLAAARRRIMIPGEGLLERLEAARVGGSHFDQEIANTYLEKRWIQVDETGMERQTVWVTRDGPTHETLPRFTTSLDAALLLYKKVPEMVPTNPLVVCRQAVRACEELPILQE